MKFFDINNFYQKKHLILILFLCTVIFYGFSLPFSLKNTPHFSPGNDFSNHAHLMYRFAESFKSGQIIPRTIVEPTIFADATIPTYDIPTFQYYGFLEGLIALPFHLVGISDTICAVLGSILVRFLGLWLLFETCLLLGTTPLTAFLASFSLLISPYTLSVFYGRGALAEDFAQSILILIPYGLALAYKNRTYDATIAFAVAFLLLPLCHNIFFLYGLLFLIILALFSLQIKIILSAAIGSLIGILMSAWQWLPSQNTVKDLTIFNTLNSWKLGSAGVEFHAASLSGILGIPQPYLPIGYTQPFPLYFTLGWWTVPFILLALIPIFKKWKASPALPFFISAIIFFSLSFWPFNQFLYLNYVPQVFAIVQTTSRLIGFVSLLGALCFAIAIPKLSLRVFQVLLALMIASQIPVFICFFKLSSQQSWSNDQIRSAPMNYYYTNPNNNNSPIKINDGTLNKDNRFYILSNNSHPFLLRLKGFVMQRNEPVQISLAALQPKSDGEYKISNRVSKPVTIQSDFNIILNPYKTSPSGWYRIILTSNNNSKNLDNNIALTRIDLIPNNLLNWIFEENINVLKKPFGYSRQYQVKENELLLFKADKAGFYTIELPTAYSKLFLVTQNGKKLSFSPDFNHRIVIRTKDLKNPITVSYTLDNKSIILTFLGILGFGLILFLKKRKSIARK